MRGFLSYLCGYGVGLWVGWYKWGRPLKRVAKIVDEMGPTIRRLTGNA